MLKELLSKKIRLGLHTVKYNFLGDLCEESEIDFYDEINIGQINKEFFEVLVTRKVFFEPKDVFDLEVTYYVHHLFNENITLPSIDEVKEAVFSDVEYYTHSEQAKVSLLIAEITNSFSSSPLITPPGFIEKE
jgi:hypothetical protein